VKIRRATPATRPHRTAFTDATKEKVVGKRVLVSDCATGGTGTEADPWTGWNNAGKCTWAARTHYHAPAGWYAYSSALALGFHHLHFTGDGEGVTVLKFTGAGPAVTVASNTEELIGVRLENFDVVGNAAATNGLFIKRNMHGIWRNVRFRLAFQGPVIETNTLVVLGVFDNVKVSGNEEFFTTAPSAHVKLVDCYATTWINPILEGNGGTGMDATTGLWLSTNSANNVFVGGTSEGVGRGLLIDATAYNNIFTGMDLEANQIENALVSGKFNAFYDLVSATAGNSGVFRFGAGAEGNRVIGGRYAWLTMNAGSITQIAAAIINYQGTAGQPGYTDNGDTTFDDDVIVENGVNVYGSIPNSRRGDFRVLRSDATNRAQFVASNAHASGTSGFALRNAAFAETAKWTYSNATQGTFFGTSGATNLDLGANGTPYMSIVGSSGKLVFGPSGTQTTRIKHGTCTLVAGVCTVSDASVTASSRILLTSQLDGGTPGWLRVSARSAGVSFSVTSSSAADTSTVAYSIVEP